MTFNPDLVSPPGDTIAKILEEQGLSEEWLASQLNLSFDDVSLLICGNLPIDWNLAFNLEITLGETAYFWMNLEVLYRYSI